MIKLKKIVPFVALFVSLFTFGSCSKELNLEGTLLVKVGRHTKTITVWVYPYESNWLNRCEELESVQLTDKEMKTTFILNAGNYLVSLSSSNDIKAVQVRAGKEVVLDFKKSD